ncbi:class I SAM-dependent methyltransferase [Halocatena halophila]|uniref:class I SAM-dependent methyltransferase n=1 Tax=Halocatena halophila TaxID=2814576 RepID=UPI002ED315C4
MNDDQRSQILDTARYLQNVRPIDPEELRDYVEGHPHPAAIRQVLREHAFELGMAEREEGFVPVADGPIAISGPVGRIPEDLDSRLEALLVERFGRHWATGESATTLRERITRLKADYFAREPVEYDAVTALAYAIYHLYDNYAVMQHAIGSLIDAGLIPHHCRILDVGAGVGGPAMGALELLSDGLIEYHAVEPSPAISVFERLWEGRTNQSVRFHQETAESFEPTGEYDLLVFANVLSELDDPAATLARYTEYVAGDGSCLLLAPADQNTAIELRTLERGLADDGELTVYDPTLRLWPNETPGSDAESWSFTIKDDIATPSVQRRLADSTPAESDQEPTAFVNTDVQYAYSVLRPDGRRRTELAPNSDRFTPMADSGSVVSDRVDLVGVKLSHDLGSDNPLFLVGDGSQQTDHFAVVVRETGLNETLITAPYASVLAFENVLVLWNADESAYNCVVDDEAVVDRIA